ncbi:hypothetical protein TIFTF001_008375 [Ficus carica]|uniref:DC1 domain-containing protein n=1 Tax=Ficus carica TaxID=3494 RepID=A0AA88D0H2_FICCA|nr:hypothetical protein TIFTF001_008375 [Ficus carica]
MVFSEIFEVEKELCFACQSPCLGSPIYSCQYSYCHYHLHKRCFECPSKVVTHTSHPQHPLFLRVLDYQKLVECESYHNFYFHSHVDHPNLSLSVSPNSPEFTCSLCHVIFENSTPRFLCTKCGFVVDVECALAPPIKHHEGPGHFQHLTHPQHPMTLVDRKDDGGDDHDEHRCSACDFPCKPGHEAYFSCIHCKYLLHKSCAELPLKIEYRPIDNKFVRGFINLWPQQLVREFSCDLCGVTSRHSFFFKKTSSSPWSRVDRIICGRCFFSRPNIYKFEGHPHSLCLGDKVHTSTVCNGGYDDYCKLPVTSYELRSTESIMYCCLGCNFNVHLLCGPLPCTIEHECHLHPLVLVDLLVEDDSDEYFCDICEDRRDPRICVYYCHECKYTAHVHCVISTVVSALKGDVRNLRLKTVKIHGGEYEKLDLKGEEVLGRVLSSKIKDIMEKRTTKEQVTMLRDFDCNVWDVLISPPEEIRETILIRKLSRYSTDYLEKFTDSLNMEFNNPEERRRRFSWRGSDIFVTVEGYLIPREVAEFLVRLFQRHGDISRNSKSTLMVKSLTFSFLCIVLNEMARTVVGSITEDKLKKWYFYANYAKWRGFDVEFMFTHLKDLVRIFISRQAAAERIFFRVIERVRANDIRELQKEINLFKSRSNIEESSSSSVDWSGDFLMECLNMALISWDNKCLDDLL